MTRRFRRAGALALFCLASLSIGGCSREAPLYDRKFMAFGTIVEVSVYGGNKAQVEKAIDGVESQFRYMQKTWDPWHPGALARVDSLLGTTDWFSIAPSVRPLVVRATELSKASGGRFDPAIGKLIKLWGFNQDERPDGPPPDPKAIAALVAQDPRMTDIKLDGIRVRSSNPAAYLDFGGFAKGYGIDQTIEYLQSQGIRNAIINAGGDLRAIGRHGDRPWRIGIRNPRGKGMIASVEIQGDESVFTSGDYERFFIYKGVRYHHIIDPRTGYPTRGTTSATVIGDDGATCDAIATAMMVAGPKHWYQVAKAMGAHYVMLVAEDGTVYMNPAMAKRIHFETAKPPKVVLSPPL